MWLSSDLVIFFFSSHSTFEIHVKDSTAELQTDKKGEG